MHSLFHNRPVLDWSKKYDKIIVRSSFLINNKIKIFYPKKFNNYIIVSDFFIPVLRAIDLISVQYHEIHKERNRILSINRLQFGLIILLSFVVLRLCTCCILEHWEKKKKIGVSVGWNRKTWRMYNYVHCNNEVLYNTRYLLYDFRYDFNPLFVIIPLPVSSFILVQKNYSMHLNS